MPVQTERKWRCGDCGEVVTGVRGPKICPGCDAGDPTNELATDWREVKEKIFLMLESNLSPEVLAGMRAHNGRKPDACYNDKWNIAHKTGSIRARYLCEAALSQKYGCCSGSMKLRRVTKEVIHHYLVGRNNPDLNAWAYTA